MRVLLLTSNTYGHALLGASLAAGHEVGLIVADEPSLQSYAPAAGDVVAVGRARGCEVTLVSPKRGQVTMPRRAFNPDVIVAAGYMGSLLPSDVSSAPRGGLLLQPSLLPKYKGLAPENWVLIEGERLTGVSVVLPGKRSIYGDLVERREVPIEPGDDDLALRTRLAAVMAEMLPALLERVEGGPLQGSPLRGAESTQLPEMRPRDRIIAFDEPTQRVHDRIRATLHHPGAVAFLGDRALRIHGSRPLDVVSSEVGAGLVLRAEGEEVLVKTRDGAITLTLNAKDVAAVAAADGAMLGDAKYEVAIRVATPTDHEAEEFGIPKGAEEFPQMVVLSVAYPCNARCPNCPYTEGNSTIREWYNDTPFVSKELFEKIARECGEYASFVRITGGGEPFLHPADIVSLIEYAKGVGARVWLNTNGSLASAEKTRRLVACQTDMIEFSVDAADPETYAVVRAGLDWDALLANVRNALAVRNTSGSSTRIVVSVIGQDIVSDSMDRIAAFWEQDVGVDEVIRRKFLTWGSNTTLDALHSGDSTGYLDKGQGVPCPFPFHRLNIDSRGKIEVCGYDISGRTNFGNVNERTIKEIWQGPEFTWWRRMHLERRGAEIPLCRECPDWRYRSWKHNWQKVLHKAEAKRLKVVSSFTAARAAEEHAE